MLQNYILCSKIEILNISDNNLYNKELLSYVISDLMLTLKNPPVEVQLAKDLGNM